MEIAPNRAVFNTTVATVAVLKQHTRRPMQVSWLLGIGHTGGVIEFVIATAVRVRD